MNTHERRIAESEIRLAEAKRAFDAADLAHHQAICSRDADRTAIQLAASRVHNAGCELSRVVGLHILTWDRLHNRGDAA